MKIYIYSMIIISLSSACRHKHSITVSDNSSSISEDKSNNEDKTKIFDELEPLKITINADFDAALKISADDSKDENFVGNLTGVNSDGKPFSFSSNLNFKGGARRGFCDIPGIKVDIKNFNSPQVDRGRGTPLENLGKFQILTHCKSDPEYQGIYMKECFIYKFAEAIGAPHFKVRPAIITYQDNLGDHTSEEDHYACLMETKKNVAKRINSISSDYIDGQHKSDSEIKREHINKRDWILVLLQELFAGNTDFLFGVPPGRGDRNGYANTLLIPKNNGLTPSTNETIYIPVAFDFDLGFLVNPPPSSPYFPLYNEFPPEPSSKYPDGTSSQLELQFYGQKLLRPYFDNSLLQKIIAEVLTKKENVLNILKNFPFAQDSHRHEVQQRIEDFFTQISPKKLFRYTVMNNEGHTVKAFTEPKDVADNACNIPNAVLLTILENKGEAWTKVLIHEPDMDAMAESCITTDGRVHEEVWIKTENIQGIDE